MTMRLLVHGVAFILLSVLTQLGGIAWLLSLLFKRRWIAFPLCYAMLWLMAFLAAPMTGRVALPCFGEPLRMQSAFYCATSRHYVTPEMKEVATDAAAHMADRFPGTVTLALDGGFPFLEGFPLIPHLSHDDGEKLDLAFYYTGADGRYAPGVTRSPVGYWAFEAPDDGACPPVALTLRWGMGWLQPLWRDAGLDTRRIVALLRFLSADPRVGKIFVEPALSERLGLSHPKLRFQGCRAARHDDHIHFQL